MANCPHPPVGSNNAAVAEASSSFICFNDEAVVEQDSAYAAGISTLEAVRQGKAVLDGGATRTLASVEAMEAIMRLNEGKHGSNGVAQVCLKERPTFGFGNGSEDKCASTARLRILAGERQGEVKVHCLDRGEGPLLLSVETLRSLGAVVDFSNDLVCFRTLDPHKLIKLERSATGHQLLPMTEDWYGSAISTVCEVPSLEAYHKA